MFVPLDCPAWLAAYPNHKKACFYVDLKELEGDPLLVWHEWQIAFAAMERWRWPAQGGHGITYSDSLNDGIAHDG